MTPAASKASWRRCGLSCSSGNRRRLPGRSGPPSASPSLRRSGSRRIPPGARGPAQITPECFSPQGQRVGRRSVRRPRGMYRSGFWSANISAPWPPIEWPKMPWRRHRSGNWRDQRRQFLGHVAVHAVVLRTRAPPWHRRRSPRPSRSRTVVSPGKSAARAGVRGDEHQSVRAAKRWAPPCRYVRPGAGQAGEPESTGTGPACACGGVNTANSIAEPVAVEAWR